MIRCVRAVAEFRGWHGGRVDGVKGKSGEHYEELEEVSGVSDEQAETLTMLRRLLIHADIQACEQRLDG